MLFNKKLGVLVLATTLATGTIVTAEQIQTDSEEIQITTEDMQNTEVYSEELDTYSYSKPIPDTQLPSLTGTNYHFSTTTEEPLFKVFISNTSDHPLNVRITQGSPNGTEIAQYTIPAHTNSTMPILTASVGTKYISLSEFGGNTMSGTIAVKTATTVGELG